MNFDFQHCIRCTVCLENCPVFRVNPDFPGPKQSGPDSQRFRFDGETSVDQWIVLCSQCKRCEVACPYGANPADIILREQLDYGRKHCRSLVNRLFSNVYLLGKLISLIAPIVNKLISIKFIRRIMIFSGISDYLVLPKYRFHTIKRSWPWKGSRKSKRRVVFFYGCYLNYNRPDIGRKIRDLFSSMGFRVVLPRQVCCGLPALGNGDSATARRMAKRNASILVKYIDKGYDVVYSCTSCGLMMTKGYQGILEIESGKKIAENTYNIHEYLLKLIDEGFLDLEFKAVEAKIAYHIPCHLRALGIGYPAVMLFKHIPGLEINVLDDSCCGLAGTYGFRKKNQETSYKLGVIASKALKETGADFIMADCGACRLQLSQLSGMPARDPAEILFDSLKST
ncbi:MAG TPA: anaerobic glycerol-3-phosphate dehydrogenase subunit C, partial [Desulfobacteraceae bacterium]|nr:anaerobic glycerol-3-phosphate dehydrogenase subunit C [Desulfobacteraceae bacterium]